MNDTLYYRTGNAQQGNANNNFIDSNDYPGQGQTGHKNLLNHFKTIEAIMSADEAKPYRWHWYQG